MRFGFVVFDGLTALDFVGMFDPLTRLGTMSMLDDVEWDVCARSSSVESTAGLRFEATSVDEPLDGYDVVLVPGGRGNRPLLDDDAFLEWIGTAEHVPLLASVCTGALVLGAAGFLEGRMATTHPGSYGALEEYCTVAQERIVDDGRIVTAGGVASSIDLGLYLIERLTDTETRDTIATQMDYPYRPATVSRRAE